MQERMNLKEVEPAGYKAMLAYESYLNTLSLSTTHKDLIKIRASQLNNCTYCIDSHTRDARKNGETEQRIYALTAWSETPFFSEEDRIVLALTEQITQISNRVSDETYSKAVEVLGEKYTAEVLMAAIGINSWNRIGVAMNMVPALAAVIA